jgi:hypothetical protein
MPVINFIVWRLLLYRLKVQSLLLNIYERRGMETVLRTLPPGHRQRLHTARLTRRIQCLDSRTISLFVRMVIALGHRHLLMAGEVVDLLDGDAE